MIVAEYCQRLLTVLSRRLILHFSFALAVKLSCHFDVGTEIVLPFTGRNVLQCAANRKGAGAARACSGAGILPLLFIPVLSFFFDL